MSARPFWVLFTMAVVVLVMRLVVVPVADVRVTDDLLALKQAGLGPDEIANMSFVAKWQAWYGVNPLKALTITVGLVLIGLLAGILIASIAFRHLVSFGDKLGQMSPMDIAAILIGLLIGLLLSLVLIPIILRIGGSSGVLAAIVAFVVVNYMCIWAILSVKGELKYYFPGLSRSAGELGEAELQKPKILDTNVIIDGRIADVYRTGFLEGKVYVPNFVLEELRHIADSSDFLRRARGRRGLDILNQLQKEIGVVVKTFESVDASDPDEVDEKLVKVAKDVNGSIVTNDFNLNKVAEIHGVQVLNVNELANALKPVVLPGEEMTVSIIKEGKEANQGIAYLDDGTMIVVEGAKKHIGETVDATVTSVLQTVAGKMIFANLKSAQQEEDELLDRNLRNYSGVRNRKKTR